MPCGGFASNTASVRNTYTQLNKHESKLHQDNITLFHGFIIFRTMIISCCYIYALLVNIWTTAKVYSQVTVDGVIGGSVLLPCASNKHEHNFQDINVHWRHNASMPVYDIFKGKFSVEHQEPRFNNKTDIFPDGLVRGIFSIQLNKLEHTDAGEYECYIVHSGEYVKVWLLINESTEAKAAGGGNKSEETNIVLILITGLCVFVVVIAGGIFLFVYKRVCKTSRSQESYPAPEELEPVNQNHHD